MRLATRTSASVNTECRSVEAHRPSGVSGPGPFPTERGLRRERLRADRHAGNDVDQALDRSDGPVTPIPAGATSSYAATFEVPSRYPFPLLWFTTGGSGAHAPTVVLRGAGSAGATPSSTAATTP
jgi:hypothetical protein